MQWPPSGAWSEPRVRGTDRGVKRSLCKTKVYSLHAPVSKSGVTNRRRWQAHCEGAWRMVKTVVGA